jgi:hypothetical protein
VTFHLVYRLYPGENAKRRPPYHSKLLCFRSAIQSVKKVEGARLVLLVDADDLPPEYEALLPPDLPVDRMMLGGIGNGGTYQRQLQLIDGLPPDDVVYLSEDDYLYRPEAFGAFVTAVAELPDVDYFGLYDHPDRYERSDDARPAGNKNVWFSGGHHWRWAESTCMSFGARVGTLHADRALHEGFVVAGDNYRNPLTRWMNYDDRGMWLKLQGVGRYWWRRPRRLLATALPSLATHMDTSFLAPGVDWADVAASVESTA